MSDDLHTAINVGGETESLLRPQTPIPPRAPVDQAGLIIKIVKHSAASLIMNYANSDAFWHAAPKDTSAVPRMRTEKYFPKSPVGLKLCELEQWYCNTNSIKSDRHLRVNAPYFGPIGTPTAVWFPSPTD